MASFLSFPAVTEIRRLSSVMNMILSAEVTVVHPTPRVDLSSGTTCQRGGSNPQTIHCTPSYWATEAS
jgi:hypothetical protein